MVLNGGSVEAIGLIVFAAIAVLLNRHAITLGMAVNAFTYSTKFIDPMYEMNVCIGLVHSVREIQKKITAIIEKNIPKAPAASLPIHNICATAMEKHYEGAKIHTPPAELTFPKKYLVLGENGAGKSVFFRLLMRFERADSGSVLYDGRGDNDFISESICYVPQSPIIFNASYLENVVGRAQDITATIHQISDASEQQADALEQINVGVEQISSVVQTNSASAEESAAASQELSDQSQILKSLTSHFQLRDSLETDSSPAPESK